MSNNMHKTHSSRYGDGEGDTHLTMIPPTLAMR